MTDSHPILAYLFTLLIIFLITACNQMTYEKEVKSFKVIASVIDCEEGNIHLKILEANDTSMIGSPILPICVKDSLCMKEFYDLKDTSAQYMIHGYVSIEGHNTYHYGCLWAKAIKIESFEKLP